MRTIILRSLIMLSTLATVGAACATGPVLKARADNPAALERELQHQIDKYVTYPLMERAESMDGDVIVSLVIDAEGRVNVICAEGSNAVLQAYVLRRLAKVDIGSNPEGVWKTSHFRFRFRPEP